MKATPRQTTTTHTSIYFKSSTTMSVILFIMLMMLAVGRNCALRPPPPMAQVSTGNSNSLLATQNQTPQRCPVSVPPQWRPHLDAASKAHLAPGVALASLKHLNIVPIQVSGGLLSQQAAPTQPIAYHPQNINNAGVTIEATFTVTAVIKRSSPSMMLQPNQTVKLLYRVSAALSTMNFSLPIGASGSNPSYAPTSNKYGLPQMKNTSKQQQGAGKRLTPTTLLRAASADQQQVCAFDLSEHELAKEAKKMFKVNKNYILFLDQTPAAAQTLVANNQRLKQLVAPAAMLAGVPQTTAPQKAMDAESAQHQQHLYPMATHTPLTNQTSRALSKILCKNCVAQVPQVQLVNATFVSVSTQQRGIGGGGSTTNNQDNNSYLPNRIKLDCRVTGYPAPWVQWFRNGKLLRNSNSHSSSSNNNNNKAAGRWSVQTSKLKGRHNVLLSRLELDLRAGRNETGIYECRAMSVVAREPAVGTYTLLVLPAQYALIPMQPLVAARPDPQQPAGGERRPSVVREQPPPPQPPPPPPSSSSSSTSVQEQQQQQRANYINGGTTPSKVTASATTTNDYMPATSPPNGGGNEQSTLSVVGSASTQGPQINNTIQQQQQQQQELSKGQQCSSEMQDILCHNKGTCIKIVIGTTEELGCKCAEGYLGRRCEFKLTRHSDNADSAQYQDLAGAGGPESAGASSALAANAAQSPANEADVAATADKREASVAN